MVTLSPSRIIHKQYPVVSDEIKAAARAVFDSVVESLPTLVAKAVQSHAPEMKSLANEALSKELEVNMEKLIGATLETMVQTRIKECENGLGIRMGLAFNKELEGGISVLTKGYEDKLAASQYQMQSELVSMKSFYEVKQQERAALDDDRYNRLLEAMKLLIESLPAPQVTIPKEAIQVQLGDMKNEITVMPAEVRESVTVNVPQQFIENKIEVMPEGDKDIQYDEYSRPVRIRHVKSNE